MSDVWVMEQSSPKSDFDYVAPSTPKTGANPRLQPHHTLSELNSFVDSNGSSSSSRQPYVGVHDSDNSDTTTAPPYSSEVSHRVPSCLRRLARSWLAIRWRLATSVFAVPLPYLTAHWDIKLGDLLLTLPISAAVLAINAASAISTKDVAGTGSLPGIAMAVVFVFAVRNNSVLLAATGISYERALFYHKVAALVTILLSGLHGLAYVLAKQDGEFFENDTVLTGCVAFFSMIALYLLALNFIRRRFFELFLRLHWILFIVILAFSVIHGAGVALIGAIPWLIDVLFRIIYRPRVYAKGNPLGGSIKKAESSNVQNLTATTSSSRMGVVARDQVRVCKLPGGVTSLQFPRVRGDTGEAFKFEAGQYAFLCVPEIGILEWHPFTISSAPHEDMVTFHIRSLGDWTSKLANLVAVAPEGIAVPATFDVLVDGPYGTLSIDLDGHLPTASYSHVVMLCGGIGITPMRSIVNQLYHELHHEKKRLTMRSVRLVWAVRDLDIVSAFMAQDPTSHNRSYLPHRLLAHASGTPTATTDSTFRTDVFVTSKDALVSTGEIEAQVGLQLAPVMKLGERPNISQILREAGERAQMETGNNNRVAVLVCGPEAMVKEAISSSISLSREMGVHFDVHHEYFSF
jgi:predicted ferric reductase